MREPGAAGSEMLERPDGDFPESVFEHVRENKTRENVLTFRAVLLCQVLLNKTDWETLATILESYQNFMLYHKQVFSSAIKC